jgi:hypothetical protein
MKKLIAVTLATATLAVGGVLTAAPANAGTAKLPIGDGTGGCHRYVQVWYGGPWVSLY